MKNITNLCIDLQEGKINKKDFLREARRTFPNYITNVNTFEDTIKILKNKNLISEGCNCENQLNELTPRDEENDEPIDFDTDNIRIPKRSLRLDNDDDYDNDDDDLIEPSDPDEQDLEILKNLDIIDDENSLIDNDEWLDDEEDDYDFDGEYEEDDYDWGDINENKESKFKSMGSKYDGSNSGYNGISDELDPLDLQIGMRYEKSIDLNGTPDKWMKKVKSNLSKNPRFYTQLSLAGWDEQKLQPNVKKRTDLNNELDKKMSNTTDKPNQMSSPKGIEKYKASANKAKKEPISKIKVKDLTHKAIKAKGIKGVMDMTGGKMKKVKNLNELEVQKSNKSLLNLIQTFINSKFSKESKNISLQNENDNNIILKYYYWEALPQNILSVLKTKFNVKEDESENKIYYTITPKISSEMMNEIKIRIKKLFRK